MQCKDPLLSPVMFNTLTSKPRVSNITFSTVTSATGLPTIAAEPCRPRSSSRDLPIAFILGKPDLGRVLACCGTEY
ncbi:hypothetical protein OSTOST_26065 [Ostertagia ostertagi]